jgi:hypothetical protein
MVASVELLPWLLNGIDERAKRQLVCFLSRMTDWFRSVMLFIAIGFSTAQLRQTATFYGPNGLAYDISVADYEMPDEYDHVDQFLQNYRLQIALECGSRFSTTQRIGTFAWTAGTFTTSATIYFVPEPVNFLLTVYWDTDLSSRNATFEKCINDVLAQMATSAHILPDPADGRADGAILAGVIIASFFGLVALLHLIKCCCSAYKNKKRQSRDNDHHAAAKTITPDC